MKKFILAVPVALVAVIATFALYVHFRFNSHLDAKFTPPTFTIKDEVASADRDLGKRIFHIRNGCVDCHGANLSGAMIMENGAMGSIRGANLTPSNLNNWTDEEIATAIRFGIHKSGRSLRFMPSFDYEGLSKGDIAALIAYIRSVPPVSEQPTENKFGPIARVMSVLGKMPIMFPALVTKAEASFAEKPAEAANIQFGEYLAKTCTGCHGPEYRGGPIPGGDPSWPAAANIRLGAEGNWTEEKFRHLIATGVSPISGQTLRPPMPVEALKQLNEVEIQALWKYLSTLN